MVTRISGLASGMDIDQMVSDMMKAQKVPLDKMKQQKQWTEWQRDSYRDINTKLNELLTMAKDMNYQKTYVSKKTTSSNDGAVTATASPNSASGTYSIEVKQLAASEMQTSKSLDNTFDPTKTLSSQFSSVQTVDFTISTFNEKGEAISKRITADGDTESLNDVINKINEANLGVRAFYDSSSKQFVMERTITGKFNGSGNEISINETSGTLFGAGLQMTVPKKAQNAEFTYNGGLTINSPSNSYTLNNIQLNLKSVTTKPETITVQTDTDSTFDSIVKFVNKYNEVIEAINGKLEEKRYRDYVPLSDEQKKDMKDKDIELWEEKAKSGLLRGDSSLSSGINTMRTDFYTPLAGALQGFSQLSDLGITTSSNYLDKGKLIINDESKLRSKIAENPNAVAQLFNADGDKKTKSTMGIADRLVQTITSTIGKVEEKAGKTSWTNQKFSLGRTLDTMNKQIDSFQDRLTQMENRYYSQFTAMEKAIQRANQQSAYITQQFSG
ncbi:flagellar hook-associated protein 2 [Priestia koreensis]|uniref:flagellar hook-associated protein 2 n=2 Tax=Priestia koreensis TaxID=284581 RepID=UPI001F58FBB6|nr:flagellar hook-associated protein 2 [Priestia koreensis]UNL84769.1 flagellar hook-associated protein 2 [Priestia koreensis]